MTHRHDLVVRGATVVDGTGARPFTGDLAVDGATITAVGPAGSVESAGRREIDASGATLTPGFVDIHTHYDGQATWESELAPSSLLGVTTVVAGNCGVGFAPVRAADRDRLVELMEGVEDLPGTVLHEGLSWQWETIEEYLDALDARHYTVDIGTQVCHGPVRLYVMGERGAAGEPATDGDIAAMGEIAAAGVRAGALGFTTSRTINHRTSRGEDTPTLRAEHDELVGIARAVGRTGRGVLQVVTDFADARSEFTMLFDMMRESGRPLSISLVQGRPGGGYSRLLRLLDDAADEGLEMRGQVAARAVGVILGLRGSVNPLAATPTFQAVVDAGHIARLRHLLANREQLLDEIAAIGDEPGPTGAHSLDELYPCLFELGDPPDYEPAPETSIAARAEAAGRPPHELLVDLLLADDGENLLYYPVLNYFDQDLDAVRSMLAHPHTVAALGDGGAHVGTICDASFPMFLLTHWARDRHRGERLPIEHVVHRQTMATAAAVGLRDRGRLNPGMRADLNIVDLDTLRLRRPHFVSDLPAGGTRMLQRAEGVLHTFASGTEILADDRPTGARPGRLIRGPQSPQRSARDRGPR